MNINPNIFREYDIRGIAGKDLTAEFAETLGQVYATWALKKLGAQTMTVSVGRDCRLTSDDYADALIRGLTKSGINVIRIGVCPSPLTYFSVFHYKLDGGIMVTGSHNPAEYNGFKIGFGKDTLHGSQIQELKRIFLDGNFVKADKPGKIEDREIINTYVDYVVSIIKPQKKLKVVLDAGNGTASTVAPLLFKKLGADVIPLYCELDGRFPNHHPDPTVPKNLSALVSEVKKSNADFGVGYDGDSDRIGAVDETGRILYGDELMVVFSREVLKTCPGATIISEVKSSHRLYQDISAHGGQPIMWKTGHSLIKSKMKETKAALAGEMSGHIFFGDRWFGFDDAIYASARLYEIVSQNVSLSSLIADLPKVFNTPEIRIDCEEERKFQLIEVAAELLKDPKGKSTTIDGLRVDYQDRWGLLRASNTQPVIVMRFEAQTEIQLQDIRGRFESALQQAAQKIGHAKIQFDSAH
ncbi:MAG: phosphomannomutase/phosphoglucomutase [Bdellovibrionales bacterium]|nr:phosphomannomutase/phosphoglucomutase [Bdellovibrionales bacterium]